MATKLKTTIIITTDGETGCLAATLQAQAILCQFVFGDYDATNDKPQQLTYTEKKYPELFYTAGVEKIVIKTKEVC